jgi:hypothetical protein
MYAETHLNLQGQQSNEDTRTIEKGTAQTRDYFEADPE